MSSAIRDTKAVVLDCIDHGESDKIVTFFTADQGRITGIAKGANRSKKRFLNKLELFSYISLGYSERQRSALIFVAEAELIDSFINLRSHLDSYVTATFLREILLIATAERQGDEGVFQMLIWSLQALDEGREHPDVAIIFLIRFLGRIGYRPALSGCRNCGENFVPERTYRFHHMAGGLLCNNCSVDAGGATSELSTGTIRMLQTAIQEIPERLHRLHFSRQGQRQALTMLHHYSRNIFQREIHSWKALRSIVR